MCGIAGFFGAGDEAVLRRMTDRLVHRGPDDDGVLIDGDGRAFLGFRRLAILDIAGGRQPMLTDDGSLALVFNGEIYNFRELREELVRAGARFRTDHSDTEVLLHGYRQWGEDLPNHLNGMWAFAIHDRARRRVFLSRDRFGKKPLFWCMREGTLVFASELTALREHPLAPGELSVVALQKYFGYGFVPAPQTFFRDVHKLPAGHSMVFDLSTRSRRIAQYWTYRPEPFDARPAHAEEHWADELLTRLEGAVSRRLVADVPIGCFLSGGIDSSVVAALAMRRHTGGPIRAFTIGFEEATFDETRYARLVAQHIGASHDVETLSIERALEILPEIARRWDEPIADSSMLPTFLLCRHARRHVTVALGGDGADELLAGYDPFKVLRYAQWYERFVPKPMHRALSMLAARLPVSHRYMSFDFRLKRTLRGLNHAPPLWLPVWMAPLGKSELEDLFRTPVSLEEVFSEAIEAWDACPSSDPVERAISYYIRFYLQEDILVKVDRASMLNSLEVRAPFLDCDLVDFLRRLPSDCKLRGDTTKWILRRVAELLLPREVIERGKQGFAVPIGNWFVEDRFPRRQTERVINPDFWAQQLSAHQSLSTDARAYLWSDWLLGASHVTTDRAWSQSSRNRQSRVAAPIHISQ
jgi:asparagine synthase (glutamine-hydrolysing)